MNRVSILTLTAMLVVGPACGGDDGDTSTPGEERDGNGIARESQTIDVIGKEYAFDGVPQTVEPGPTTFTFENAGKEPHEMVIFKLKTEKSIKELLKLPQQRAQKFVEQVGGTGAGPGKKAAQPVEAELTEGTYAMVCFIPAADKTPHFAKGMVASFAVRQQ